MIKNFLLLFSFLILIESCAPVVRVDVDAIATSLAQEKKRYVLVPANENSSLSDLQFGEFACYTENVLNSLGFVKSTSEDADLLVYLSYGISDPQYYQYTYSVPVWGQTGVSASTTHGVMNRCGSSAIYSSETTYTPSYGIVGSETHLATGVVYARYLHLNGKTTELQDVWSTKAMSVGESSDLRKIFPIMLLAARPHIAGSTGQRIEYQISEKDERIAEVQGLVVP